MENVEQVSAEQKKIICPHCKKEILPCTETAVDPKLNVKCHKYCCDTMDFFIYSKKKVWLRKLKQAFIRLFLRLNNGTVWGTAIVYSLPIITVRIVSKICSPIIKSDSAENAVLVVMLLLYILYMAYLYYFGVIFRNGLSRIRAKAREKIGWKVIICCLLFLLTNWIGLILVFVFGEESIEALRARINKFKVRSLGIGGALMSVAGVVTWIWSLGEEHTVGWIGDRGLKLSDSLRGHIRDNDVPITEVIRESSLAAMIIGTLLFIAGIVLMVVAFNLSCKYSEEDK